MLGTVIPEHQVIYSGSCAVIQCISAREAKWTKHGKTLDYLTFVGILTISNVTERDSGQYVCHGVLDREGTQPFTRMASLFVACKFNIEWPLECIHVCIHTCKTSITL